MYLHESIIAPVLRIINSQVLVMSEFCVNHASFPELSSLIKRLNIRFSIIRLASWQELFFLPRVFFDLSPP